MVIMKLMNYKDVEAILRVLHSAPGGQGPRPNPLRGPSLFDTIYICVSRGISEAGRLLEALPRWGFELIRAPNRWSRWVSSSF